MSNSKITQLSESSNLFLTDGGLETTLIFLEEFDLPYFAAFDLLKAEKGYNAIKNYYKRYLNIAKKFKTGFILESATWRANPDWIEKIGYPKSSISEINEKAVQLLVDLETEYSYDINVIIKSGCIGPRGDGYIPESKMSVDEAQKYHSAQIETFNNTEVDIVSAIPIASST